jgi:hypothetical protein
MGDLEPMIPPARHGGRKRSVNLREVLNGIFYPYAQGVVGRRAQRPAAEEHGARLSGTVEWEGTHPPQARRGGA